MDALKAFFRFVSFRMYGDRNNDVIRVKRLKQMSEEIESYKNEIKSLNDQMEKMVIDVNYKKKELEDNKINYDERIKNAYKKANKQQTQLQ